MKARLVTFNVCGVKGLLSRTAQWVPERSLEKMFAELSADIVCFQELKVQMSESPKDLAIVPGFNGVFTTVKGRPGYDGVGIYVKNSIRMYKAEEGSTGWSRPSPGQNPYRSNPTASICLDMYPDNISEHAGLKIDAQQARALTVDIGVAVIIGLYCPADSQGNMSEFKDEFFQLSDWRVHKLREAGREVIVMGDSNVAREPVDSAPIVEESIRLKQPVEREDWMFANVPRSAVNGWVVNEKFVDTARKFHPARTRMFSCWDQQKNCRPANFGSRVDYILCSEGLNCTGSDIMPDLVGSDHCPVYADFDFGELEAQKPHPLPSSARRVIEKWPQGISMFFKRGSSPPTVESKRARPSEKKEPPKSLPTNKSKSQPKFVQPTSDIEFAKASSKSPKSHLDSELDKKQAESTKDLPDSPEGSVPTHDSAREECRPPEESSGSTQSDSSNQESTQLVFPKQESTQVDSPKQKSTQIDSPKDSAQSILIDPKQESTLQDAQDIRPSADIKMPPVSPRKTKQASISSMFGAKDPQWQHVEKRIEPPLCRHGEPCSMMKSKKPPRKGESFWICSRPMGGKINTSLDHRCNTFIWDSNRRMPDRNSKHANSQNSTSQKVYRPNGNSQNDKTENESQEMKTAAETKSP